MEVRICLGRAKASQETLSLHERDRCTEGDETVDRDDDTGAVAYTIQAKYYKHGLTSNIPYKVGKIPCWGTKLQGESTNIPYIMEITLTAR